MQDTTTRPTVTLAWLGLPVEVPAVEYVGSLTSHHGVYGLEGECCCGTPDCWGAVLVSPTTGARLEHVRDSSWRYL